MDLSLNENQKMLKATARDFFEKAYPKNVVREMETSRAGYSRDLYTRMAELGWLGMGIPEEYGGGSADLIDLVILYEEIGRALVPGPHFISTIVCASIIEECGTEEQKRQLLPRISSGESIFSLAQYELEGGYGARSVTLPAIAEGQNFVLSGIKLFVPYSHVADYLICVVRTGNGASEQDGISLLLVDAKAPGITHNPLVTIAGDKQNEVILDKVKTPAVNLLGPLNDSWRHLTRALQKSIVLQCAEMVGGAEKAKELAVAYAKQRVQFGRPIGCFPAVQRICADMVPAIEGARYLTYEAACKLRDGEALVREAHMAKAFASAAYRSTTSGAHQVFCGVGYMLEHELNLYYRRAKALELALGDVDYHVRQVAAQWGTAGGGQ